MKILIAGSSGLIGSSLVRSFSKDGHEVHCLLRASSAPGKPWWDSESGVVELCGLDAFDAVINLAGENIAGGRWNVSRKERILRSRVEGSRLLLGKMLSQSQKPAVVISASAVGFYGDCADRVVDEDDVLGKGFLADVCTQWEHAYVPATEAGVRVVNLRLGMVLSDSGGALEKMLLPFKLGLGGVIGSGKQYVSWISVDDVIGAISHVLKNEDIRGPINLVSSEPVTNHEFTKALGSVLNRPTFFALPAFAARMIMGEMADELLLSSIRAIPKKLMDSGYEFRHPELMRALKAIINK
jgi:uncharacterized protein